MATVKSDLPPRAGELVINGHVFSCRDIQIRLPCMREDSEEVGRVLRRDETKSSLDRGENGNLHKN